MSTIFGQIVIGPPGSGKTTYCYGMSQFLKSLGRKVAIINIDPANDIVPYDASINISNLITLEDVMENMKLGPNGGLIYCLEYLEKNIEWLLEQLNRYKDCYLLFDFPGQIELYTHHNSVKNIIKKLEKFGTRLCAVHLVDSHYCNDAGKFISILLISLSAMLQIELPHVNVLSKVDLIERYGKLHFGLDFYTEVLNLDHLLDVLHDDPFTRKFNALNVALAGLIEDYSLVSFVSLNVNDKESMLKVKNVVDKANGYVFGSGEERNIQALLSTAMGVEFEYRNTGDARDKYMSIGDNEDSA